MTSFKVMLTNWWTTAAGFIAGFLSYMADVGLKVPTNKAEGLAFLKGAAIFALGLVAKSATTGSAPGAPKV